MDWFLYDNGLRHERVKTPFREPTPAISPLLKFASSLKK